MNEQGLQANAVEALRRRFAVGEDEFRVILVGKDGGEKFRTDRSPDLEELFRLIDGMPMRRREMGLTGPACGGAGGS